mmetsp:Transcript_15836/g.23835  ORF Transcript_15836/g.23835 Transcript_15836/m.23835 type:complete len:220 (+) Transcript_15836:441-1100(+)
MSSRTLERIGLNSSCWFRKIQVKVTYSAMMLLSMSLILDLVLWVHLMMMIWGHHRVQLTYSLLLLPLHFGRLVKNFNQAMQKKTACSVSRWILLTVTLQSQPLVAVRCIYLKKSKSNGLSSRYSLTLDVPLLAYLNMARDLSLGYQGTLGMSMSWSLRHTEENVGGILCQQCCLLMKLLPCATTPPSTLENLYFLLIRQISSQALLKFVRLRSGRSSRY